LEEIMTGDIVEKDKMVFADLSDLQMASKVRMLMRGDLEHEAVCCGARDRIMYLSQQVKRLEKENEKLGQNVCDVCSPDNYGWVENRVEGRGACVCMTEAEPFQILLTALEKIVEQKFIHGAEAQFVALTALKTVLPLDYAESV
jgi:hypothetical protein